jgi:hypothetical protein
MNNQDNQLRELLRQWKDIEPPGNFESNVWRKIRLAEPAGTRPVGWGEWWHVLLAQPAFSIGVSMLTAVFIGGAAGWFAVNGSRPPESPLFSFLSSDTLSGGYLDGKSSQGEIRR